MIQIRNRRELEVNLADSASDFLCFSFSILLVINNPKPVLIWELPINYSKKIHSYRTHEQLSMSVFWICMLT